MAQRRHSINASNVNAIRRSKTSVAASTHFYFPPSFICSNQISLIIFQIRSNAHPPPINSIISISYLNTMIKLSTYAVGLITVFSNSETHAQLANAPRRLRISESTASSTRAENDTSLTMDEVTMQLQKANIVSIDINCCYDWVG